jgi:hypothetical protein
MSYTPIISITGGAAGGGNDWTSGSFDTTGADFVALGVCSYLVNPAPTLTDNKSNSWTGLTLGSVGSIRVRLFFTQGGTFGTGHTIAIGPRERGHGVCGHEPHNRQRHGDRK